MKQNGYYVALHKTRKIEVNDKTHPLPPSLGTLQEFKVSDYFCPDEWSRDGFFVLVEEGQPLWFDFSGYRTFGGNPECAVLCSVQRLNPVTGEPANLEGGLSKDPVQNYLALPAQKWLDGYAKDGKVYQFVVTKAGEGLAVNEFVLPKHMQDSHALGFAFFAAKKPKKANTSPGMAYAYPAYPGTKSSYPQKISVEPMWVHVPQPDQWKANGPTFHHTDLANSVLRCSSLPKKYATRSDSGDSQTMAGPADGATAYCESLHPGGDDVDGIAAVGASAVNMCMLAASVEDVQVVDRLADVKEEKVSFDKASMGAGGRIAQDIISDENTVDYYQDKPAAVITVYLALPEQFDSIMKKGRRQDSSRPDKYVHSGEIGGVQVPLVK